MPVDAKDTVVGHIRRLQRSVPVPVVNGLKAARLVCRAFRELVDTSVCSTHLILRREDVGLLEEGELPPLTRWPRCSEVFIYSANSLDDNEAGTVLAALFAGLPLDARERITRLDLPGFLPGAAVSSALRCLPALQYIKFRTELPEDRLEQRLIFHSLASLPGLQELCVNLGPHLEFLPMLEGRGLRRLTISMGDDWNWKPDATLAATIARLDGLEHLAVSCVDNVGQLLMLTRSLPPTVRTLELGWCEALDDDGQDPISAEIGLCNRSVTSIKAAEIRSGRLAQFLCSTAALLDAHGGTTQPQLQSFHVKWLVISNPEDGDSPEGLQLLGGLLRRCSDIQVKYVLVQDRVCPAGALEVLSLLGGLKGIKLQLDRPVTTMGFTFATTVSVSMEGSPLTAAARCDDCGGAPPQPRPSLLDLALARLLPDGSTTEEEEGEKEEEKEEEDGEGTAVGEGTVGGAVDSDELDGVDMGHRGVLLRGPSLTGFASDHTAFKAWAELLCRRAGIGEASGACAFLPLPQRPGALQGAVIVQCYSAADAKALAAAATAAPADLAGAPAASQQPQAEALRVDTFYCPVNFCILGRVIRIEVDVFSISALEEAAQEVWNDHDSGWSQRQRLQWLLEEWASARVWHYPMRVEI